MDKSSEIYGVCKKKDFPNIFQALMIPLIRKRIISYNSFNSFGFKHYNSNFDNQIYFPGSLKLFEK